MDEVGDATDCWVCTDAFTDPRILSCGHTFCLRCLTEIQKTTITSTKETLSCPFFRQVFTVPKDGLAALPKNYSLTKLIEASRPSDPCDQHRSRSLEMYCVDCGSVVCVRCLVDGHQLHQCCSIEKAAEVYRRMMQEYALRFSGFASSVRSQRRVTTDRSTATLMSIERADVRVRERARQLKQLIDRQAMSLLCELDHRRQAAWMDVQGEFERFVEHIEELERFRKFCYEAEKYSSVELCRNVGQLESTAEELGSRHHARIAEYVAGRGQSTETVFKDACIEEILNSERNNIVGRIEAVVNQPLKRVKVTQNYESRLEDELTLQCGDIIDVIKQNDAERCQGILNGKIGLFPVNFVEVIDQLSEDQSVQLGRVLHSYTAQTEDELDLLEGDTVTILCDESSSCGEGWVVGVIEGKMGMLPGNYVEILETKSAEKVAESEAVRTASNPTAEVSTHKETSAVTPLTNIGLNPQNGLVVRPHVPDSENTDELRLCIGDVIKVLYQDSPYEGWWTGETDDCIGVFPWNCVQLLPQGNENPLKTSVCPPTSTATPEAAGYTSDTTTAAASRPPFAMDDIVKNNEDNEICVGKLKDNGQPRNNGQPRDNGQPEENNGQPEENNGQPEEDNGQPEEDNGQPTTVMNQPQSPETIAQTPKEDNPREVLQVAKTKNEATCKSRPTRLEDEEAVVKPKPIEGISSDTSECSREKLRSKRNKFNTDSGPTGRQHLSRPIAADVECRSIRIQHPPPPPLSTPSSTAESSAGSGIVKHRRSPGRATNLIRAKVVFDYSRQHEDELNLRVGDIITVLCQNLTDEGWWKGELNGNVGIFPENFVKILGKNSMIVGRSCASPVLRGTDGRIGSTTSEVNRRRFQVRIFTDDPQILRLSKGLITSSGNSSLVNSCD